MEKILIVGGAGYVGTELIDILINKYKVTVYDLFIYGDNLINHENLIKICIFLSLCFLVMYIAYHITSDPTKFGGTGAISYLYYFILISHILLSVTVIPFVMVSYFRAINNDFKRHKKIAKITFPIWLYVAVTGVVVYVMISPYYS